jgi:hypothetical protein
MIAFEAVINIVLLRILSRENSGEPASAVVVFGNQFAHFVEPQTLHPTVRRCGSPT